ncbi:TPA: M24 family metallopeptidase [Vibrio parahaemolyticus]|nr:aminopeptidase P family protein [Vibrio parahaemolyticus]EJX5600411.1 aminopeptidase P family protein [Vibrio parahaemolyticus]ELA6921928.1 aminopeptidase P family protein [Vibrio parahaemolyticus]HAS6611517.1 M24 family metallopeptidase [Vibrio parahaemolyticus]HAS6622129.1 M24 family metallopeptidase [Vibrio parahaemolyticus]
MNTTNSVNQRLSSLRDAMANYKVSAYIVTNNDPHNSEYSADHWAGRTWISGFTGSAGNVVITQQGGGLWTDGRYYIQAEEQLHGTGLDLFKARQPETPTIPKWLANTLDENSAIAVDGRSISYAFYQELKQALEPKNIEIVLDLDLITPIWTDRPSRPSAEIFDHPVAFSGVETKQKLADIRKWLNENHADCLLVSTLDDVMWTLNIRGGDTLYCPVSESYLIIERDRATAFIDKQKLPAEIEKKLTAQGVSVRHYEYVSQYLNQQCEGLSLAFSPVYTNSLLVNSIEQNLSLKPMACPVTDMKAIKNQTELANLEQSLTDDGVAVVKFMSWLEDQVPSGLVTELSAEAQLKSYRRQTRHYVSDSFRTIAGFAAHGAKMHYAADEESNAVVNESNFFLVDSGGQYLGGTTDITRTFHFGSPTIKQRKDYTLVLKAVIRLTQTRFMKGSTGANLDIMARGVLWQHGIDYKCGTGHGVGICLNVHEGPQNFSQSHREVELKPGMVITNEPGVYREGEYGVRIENIMKVVEVEQNEFGIFYGFETITLAPIATNILDVSLLSHDEINWLNQYHSRVYQALSPFLDEHDKAWLQRATQFIEF